MYKKLYFLIISIVSICSQVHSQKPYLQDNDSKYKEQYKYISNFFKSNTLSNSDSAVFTNFIELNNFSKNDTIAKVYKHINYIIQKNVAQHNISKIEGYIHELENKKLLYDSLMNIWIYLQEIKAEIDSGHVSSTDSNFVDYLDIIFGSEQDSIPTFDSIITNTDTATVDTAQYTSNTTTTIDNSDDIFIATYKKYYENDSLLAYMRNVLEHYKNNEIINWIKEVRRDTFEFYIISSNDDSVTIRLYKNNPELLRFPITDIWGKETPAIVRNIQPNSMKLMIDDSPKIKTNRNPQNEIRSITRRIKDTLTISYIPLPPDPRRWSFYGNSSVDASQVGMYQWAQGGDPSVSFLISTELFLNYRYRNQMWKNHGTFKYGMIRQGRYQDKEVNKFNANEDRLEINSKYNFKSITDYNFVAEADLKTQFMPQNDKKTDEVLSMFMSPGYTTFSVGAEYKRIKNLYLYVSPVALKTTFVLDTSNTIKTRYNVDTTKISRSEFGFRLQASHKITIWEKIKLTNKIELYTNYLDRPENIDVNWEMQLDLPINEWLRASVSTHMIYDHDQLVPKYNWEPVPQTDGTIKDQWVKHEGIGIQFKEAIRLGIKIIF